MLADRFGSKDALAVYMGISQFKRHKSPHIIFTLK
jgi:hypothetical protein